MDKRFSSIEDQNKRITTIRSQNKNHLARIAEMLGGRVPPIHAAFMDYFTSFLVVEGVLTEEQLSDFYLRWEENVGSQLNEIEEQINLQRANMQAAERAKQSGLVLPGQG